LERLAELMAEAGCDALVVSSMTNVRYLSGFSGSSGVLVVREHEAVLVTDGRYGTQAPEELAVAGTAGRCRVEAALPDGQEGVLESLVAGARRLAVEAEHLSWAAQQRCSTGWARGIELVATTGLVERLRERKAPAELERMALAASIADEAFANVHEVLENGPTEAGLALLLDTEMRRLGAEGSAFETIVASGPNAGKPHHRPTQRKVGRGELVVVDFGARVEGYCSDMTRTVWAGELQGPEASELRRLVAVVLASQEAGLAAVRDGARAAVVDRACREVVEAAGWGERFVHGTGHGVGLAVHEAPALATSSSDILSCGHVVTVEPGVYLPGFAGARTEDTVVVGENGCRVLTATPKQVPGPSEQLHQ
jgi:Xaa-Pro aminopeptidase